MASPQITQECSTCLEQHLSYVTHATNSGTLFMLDAKSLSSLDHRAHLICMACFKKLHEQMLEEGRGDAIPCPQCRILFTGVRGILARCVALLPSAAEPASNNQTPPSNANEVLLHIARLQRIARTQSQQGRPREALGYVEAIQERQRYLEEVQGRVEERVNERMEEVRRAAERRLEEAERENQRQIEEIQARVEAMMQSHQDDVRSLRQRLQQRLPQHAQPLPVPRDMQQATHALPAQRDQVHNHEENARSRAISMEERQRRHIQAERYMARMQGMIEEERRAQQRDLEEMERARQRDPEDILGRIEGRLEEMQRESERDIEEIRIRMESIMQNDEQHVRNVRTIEQRLPQSTRMLPARGASMFGPNFGI